MQNGVNENPHPRRLAFYSLGFFRPKLRNILAHMGYSLVPFGIGAHDAIIVWGRKPVSKRGITRAQKQNLPLLTIEDGFIRSLRPGWQEAPRSITLDWQGVYFDAHHPSNLRAMLFDPPAMDEGAVRAQMELQVKLGVSKYNSVLRGKPIDGGVVIIDQVRDDQSVKASGGDDARFKAMIDYARSHFPDSPITLRTHPAGKGYFHDTRVGVQLSDAPANPFDVIDGSKAILTLSSQMGFDAIIAGKTPIVFGQPFYSGLGLTDDQFPPATKTSISLEALYDIAINRYCHFFAQDQTPSDALTQIFALHDEARATQLALTPIDLKDMRAWKRPHLKRFFPNQNGTQVVRWGERHAADEWVLEDGFLRSRGLGAKLVPPLSLILDKTGIYFDPSQPSDLEHYIHARAKMHPLEVARARNLQRQIVDNAVSKYNLAGAKDVQLPQGKPILLVVGQVEDDRSIKLGATGDVKNNTDLIAAAKREYPEHFILYKPHPDVMAKLRTGEVKESVADMVYEGEAIEHLWAKIDRIATISSLSGFEALLRGVKVSCFGMPFYADWGLTDDFAPSTERRGRATLEALIYATLIDYPLYLDPVTRQLSTAEVIVKRLAEGDTEYPAYLRASTWAQQQWYRARDYARNS